jgi:SAM-dependent methyltransferase
MSAHIDSDSSADRSEVYYQGQYWNDLSETRAHLNRLATGDSHRDWIDKILEMKPPGHGLILNCGNGWVERELFDRGVLSSALAIDVSPTLIEEAETAKAGREIKYVCHDINTFHFGQNEFDFVINFAAMHHTQMIDRTMRGVWSSIKPDGLFVSWDYIGPHRNQYSYEVWEIIHQINKSLPGNLRSDMSYPHLPTMLLMDPTEAIHSELFLETHDRYFSAVHQSALGGAIAYPLLTHNRGIHAATDSERTAYIIDILKQDVEYTSTKLKRSLFAFLISKKKAVDELNQDDLDSWTVEEQQRERRASVDGKYYEESLLQHLTQRIVQLQDQLATVSTSNVAKEQSGPSIEKRLTRLESQLNLLLNSRSLRVTKPFRHVYKMLRRSKK